jgi:hypothetical protein
VRVDMLVDSGEVRVQVIKRPRMRVRLWGNICRAGGEVARPVMTVQRS